MGLDRVHGCSKAATKTAWMAAVMSAPDMAPPLAAAASALVIDGEFRLGRAWQRRGCQQGQYRVIMPAVGVLYGHLLGAQRALAAAALRAAPLVLRNVVLCEMEVI